MPQTNKLIAKGAYARRRGVHPSAISAWLKAGKIVETDGKIDWKRADKALDAVLSKTNGGPRTAGVKKGDTETKKRGAKEGNTNAKKDEHEFPPGSMAAIRIAREQLSLDKQRLEFEEMSGKLIDSARAETRFRHNIEVAVKMLERFPDKLAPRCAVESREFEIRRIIRAEVVELCRELSSVVTTEEQ